MPLRNFLYLVLALGAGEGLASAQQASSVPTGSGGDWIKAPADPSARVSVVQAVPAVDPFAVVSTGALWRDASGVVYQRSLDDSLLLSYGTTTQTFNEGIGGGDFRSTSQSQNLGWQFRPAETLTLRGDVHGAIDDDVLPGQDSATTGARLTAEGKLLFASTLTLSCNSDETAASASTGTTSRAYDAQFRQPLGRLPLTAVLKAHAQEITAGDGAPPSRLPSLEQSLVWKPAEAVQFQVGLRQQQYEDVPGVSNALNEALFADWSQTLLPDLRWHSYAEVLGSRTAPESAPPTPGPGGTVATSAPPININSAGALPSLDDSSLAFTTGPSFQLNRGVSANIEYSNRWDRNAISGTAAQEQRVSVSLKGSF